MFYDVQQNTDEWLTLRMGKITSSHQGSIMANLGKSFGNPAVEYAQKIALEIVTGELDETNFYSNAYMERGHELEPIAIDLYQMQNFTEVANGGFFTLEDNHRIQIGDSPDGLVGANGCIEVKSVIPKTQWKRIKKGGIDTSYKWQIQSHLWVTGRMWCDFISYCPEMPENNRLIVVRVERNEEMIKQLEKRNNEFRKLIKEHIELLKN